jgi:hypothetical protein
VKSFDELLAEYRKLGEEIKLLQCPTPEWIAKAQEIISKREEIENHPDYPKP